MNMDNNPFKAPAARVDDLVPLRGTFIPDGQKVPAGNAVLWISRGWELFRQAPGTWIGIAVVFVIILLALSFIPLLNLFGSLLMPVFVGGLMLGCNSLDEGGGLRFDHLFSGFSGHAGNLMLVGLIYMVGAIAIVMLIVLMGTIFGLSLFAATGNSPFGDDAATATLFVLLLVLVVMLLMLPLVMAVWYAPALVVFHEASPLDAMKSSFFACLKNIPAFLLYGLIWMLLAILASLPLLLGWLILAPLTYGSVYASYRDMFIRE